MVPAERVDDVVRVPHVMLLTIERANAAPSAAGGAKDDAAETMDSIEGVRDGDGGAPLSRHRGLEVSGEKTGHRR